MGSFFSVGNTKSKSDGSGWNEVSPNEKCKRQRMSSHFDEESLRLIPNLPDELSLQIIARLPRICYLNLRLVSRKWKATIMSSELYKVRKELGTTEEWLYLLIKVGENKLLWHALDPRSRIWQRLPTMPNVVDEEESRKGSSRLWMWNMVEGIRIAEVIRGFLGQKDAFDEMPFCGCAIGAVDGCLYVLGGFSKASTMRCVWRFDPIQNTWSKVTPMSTGRAYCKTGILNNKLYVVGGVSQGQAGLVPLQSAEVFDPSTDTWSHVPSMPFSRAQVPPTAFLADMLKPIATGLTSYMGRLCVPQSLYSWPFFVDVGGEIYDPETNSWIEMPIGMGEGWPARQAGTKLPPLPLQASTQRCVTVSSKHFPFPSFPCSSYTLFHPSCAPPDTPQPHPPSLSLPLHHHNHHIFTSFSTSFFLFSFFNPKTFLLSHGSSPSSTMPSFSSLYGWIGRPFLGRNPQSTTSNGGDSGSDVVVVEDSPIINTVECYACTQVGVPVFHSTSCDSCHQPQWEASAGSSLIPIQNQPYKGPVVRVGSRINSGPFGQVLDPRSKRVQVWNRALLLARGVALAIDPLFFYALSIGREGTPCLYMDGGLAAMVTVVRTCVDAVHLFHLWLQFKLAYVSRESLVVGCGKLVWDARAIASHYLRSLKGFWFDAFVILPVPQAVFWLIVPKLIREERIKIIMTIMLLIFLFQFLPKVYHSICMMRRMQKVTGYIFGTIWWGFGLNLIAYFIASHVAGGCWYVLAIQRVASCLQHQCERTHGCNLSLSCSEEVCYQFLLPAGTVGNPCGGNSTVVVRKPLCLDVQGPFQFGIYQWALPVISSNSLAVKILYPIFWGLMTLSTFGNDLEPTSNWLEVIFSICIVLSGLLLFTLLIGNIQVFLHAVMAKKRKMQLRCRDMEWWMRRRQLPSRLKQRVRHFERQRWAAMGGEDEMELIKDLPEGLRRDIKRYLCLDLIKKVPLFHNLDDLILDNICDRVKPLVFSKDEKIIREGDPVPRMVFIVRGRIKRNQSLSKGMVASSILEPGGFLGDELLSWCLRRPFVDRLPASSATFVCLESAEAFGLDADNLRYITDHFRYKFANERLKRTARYYSSNWRTWAAVNIQFAWRRYRHRTRGPVTPVRDNGGTERRLLQYAAMFMSIRPHDHLE